MLKASLFTTLMVSMLSLAQAQLPLPTEPHIVVEGVGTIDSTPDIATIGFSVEFTGKTLSGAKQQVDQQIAKAIEATRSLAISDDDINASRIQAQPQYQWHKQQREYLGERVSRQVSITLRNTDNYNALVDALLAAGISRLNHTQLQHSQIESLEQQALNKALDNARNKANSMAKHQGVKIDQVFQIAPKEDRPIIRGMEMRAAMMSDAQAKAPLKVGKQTIEQRIRVVYLLKH